MGLLEFSLPLELVSHEAPCFCMVAGHLVGSVGRGICVLGGLSDAAAPRRAVKLDVASVCTYCGSVVSILFLHGSHLSSAVPDTYGGDCCGGLAGVRRRPWGKRAAPLLAIEEVPWSLEP